MVIEINRRSQKRRKSHINEANQWAMKMMAEPQILCQLNDHAKQYDNDDVCHIKRTVEVAWQYERSWMSPRGGVNRRFKIIMV